MKERFKEYLEREFRQIAPTKGAMEYRKTMLVRMLDRAQELRIRGMNDDDLIYATVTGELGDFSATLREYEKGVIKREVIRRSAVVGAAAFIGWMIILVGAYLIVGCVARIWHPTWLIIVVGEILGVVALLVWIMIGCAKKKQFFNLRVIVIDIEALLATTLFLFLQLVGGIRGSWMTFLAMVALMACVDAVLAFVTSSKGRWVELPICVEIVCVMLYIILGIGLSSGDIAHIWHPGWLLCLGGVAVAVIEVIVYAISSAEKEERKKTEKNTNIDESFWTEWDD